MKKIVTCLLTGLLSISVLSGGIDIHATELRDKDADGFRYYSNEEAEQMIDDIAFEIAEKDISNSNQVPFEVQKEETAKQLRENFDKKASTRAPAYDAYRTDSPTVKTVTAQGFADGQPTDGFTRKTGDILYWNPNGGKTVTVGVSFGYKNVSFSVALGFGGTNAVGSGFRVPSNGKYKVYVIKDYKVSNPNVYGHPYNSPAGTWVRIDSQPTKTYSGDRTHLKKV